MQASPAPVPAFSWTGCYVGASGGGIWGSTRNTSFDPVLPGNITNDYHLSGGLAGGTLGCNYQVGRFVFGIEGDDSWTNIGGSTNALAPFTTTSLIDTQQSWIATIRGRAGVTLSDRWLVYVTGGGAFTNAKLTITDPAFGVQASQSNTRSGWTLGAGVEWAFISNWSLKAEYLHADFGSSDYFVPDIAVPVRGVTYTFLNQSSRLTNDLVRVGVNYKFF